VRGPSVQHPCPQSSLDADDHDDEVDLVIEDYDGRVLAFEVKAHECVSCSEFKALRRLREVVGVNFAAGLAFSTGSRSHAFEDHLHVMPIDTMWRPVSLEPCRESRKSTLAQTPVHTTSTDAKG